MKDLLAHFGFSDFPFEKSIKPKNLFVSEAMRECQARLECMKRRHGIMRLSGDPGVGKTLALRAFSDSLNDNLFKPIYTPLATLSEVDLLRHINQKLHLTPRLTKSALFEQIKRELLESYEQRGKTIILMIDEAHLLHMGTLLELKLLTNFKMDSCDPFILILTGQSDVRRLLDRVVLEPLAQRLTMTYHFHPLSLTETANYVAHHLALVGVKEPLLTQDALGALFDITFGIPRKIASITIQPLTYAMFDSKHSVDADTVMKVNTGGMHASA